MIGRKFGRLVVIELNHRRPRANAGPLLYFKCRCDCGEVLVADGRQLRRGHTQSCGCLHRARVTKHGGARDGNLHPLYRTWGGILTRCRYHKGRAYKNYGGRGITVDPRWLDFRNFIADMMPTWKSGLTVERKDNNGPYSKANCVWATMLEQHRNKRTNKWLTFEGEKLIEAEWSRRLGFKKTTLNERLRMGWSVAKALGTPVRPRRNTR